MNADYQDLLSCFNKKNRKEIMRIGVNMNKSEKIRVLLKRI